MDQETNIHSIVGGNRRAARKACHLTQEGLADKAGVTCRQYGNIERGKTNVTIGTLDLLCSALYAPIESVFKQSGVPAGAEEILFYYLQLQEKGRNIVLACAQSCLQ